LVDVEAREEEEEEERVIRAGEAVGMVGGRDGRVRRGKRMDVSAQRDRGEERDCFNFRLRLRFSSFLVTLQLDRT
jgi:hypothetical protein